MEKRFELVKRDKTLKEILAEDGIKVTLEDEEGRARVVRWSYERFMQHLMNNNKMFAYTPAGYGITYNMEEGVVH